MSARRRARSDKINIRHYGPGRLRLPLRFAARRKVAVPVLSWLAAGGRWIRTLGPPVEDGAWTASAELREVPAGQLRFAPDSPLEESGFEPSVPLGEKRSCQAWTPHAEPARADSDGHCLAARPRWHGSRMIRSNTDSRSARPPNGYSLECPFLEHVDYCLINEILLFPIVRSSDYFLGAGQIHERCSPTFNERDP